MKLLAKRIICLTNNGKQIIELGLIYLSKDFITFRKEFER